MNEIVQQRDLSVGLLYCPPHAGEGGVYFSFGARGEFKGLSTRRTRRIRLEILHAVLPLGHRQAPTVRSRRSTSDLRIRKHQIEEVPDSILPRHPSLLHSCDLMSQPASTHISGIIGMGSGVRG